MTSPLLSSADANARALLAIEQETAREASELLREQTRQLMAQLHRVWPGDDAPAAAKMAAIRSLDLSHYEFVASQAGFKIDAGVARAFDHGIGAAINQTVGPASRAAWEKKLGTLEIQSSYLKKAAKELAQLQKQPMELGAKFNTGKWNLVPDPVGDIQTPNGIVHTRLKEGPGIAPSRELMDSTGVNRAVREQVTKARVLMSRADSLAQVQQAITVAGASASRAERVATWATNRANSEAFRQAQTGMNAERDIASKLVRMWRAERDACLYCLAYQGNYAEEGADFPAGLTFAAAPLTTGPVPDPPMHPYCRCEVVLVSLDRVGPVSDALKREAERSVLKGWSRPSESEKARVEAADRLVKRGTKLPASVQKSAKTAVKKGHFDSRSVPTGAVGVSKTVAAPAPKPKMPAYKPVHVIDNPHSTSEPSNVADVYLQSIKEYNKIKGLTGKARKQPDPTLLETLRTKYANRAEQAADERGGWLFSSDPDVRAFRIWSETYQGLNLQRHIERNMAAGQDPWLGIRKDKLDEFRKATWQQAGLKQSDYSLEDAKNDLHNAALRLHYHAEQAPIEPEPLWRGMRVDDISKWRPGYVFEADHTSWTRSENAATHYAAASMSGDFRQGRHGVIITMQNAHGFRIDQYNTVDWDETITSGRYRVKSAQWEGSLYRIIVEEVA